MTTYGLLGFPLGHSFSKKYFTSRFEREGINAQYLNFETPNASELLKIVAKNPELKGLNVTIPHKKAVIPLLDSISEQAREIGAVNCIRIERQNGGRPRLIGYNADIIGFTRSITPLLKPHHKRALVLGTGGASQAISYGLKNMDIEVTHVSRTPQDKDTVSYSGLTSDIIKSHQVVVNCTPLGTWPNVDECPPIPHEFLTPRHLLYDLVYNPEKTLFLKRGEEQGATIKNGLEMLHLQAEASYAFWNQPQN
ncbi:MAG: shikimate dehydrogenase [Bacteroidaceae bacterium]|nr:shikimate dehydrogenase [Bacteroidaceae bacterium]